ncbi:Eco57I restriction-modification methylase domain-containing protein [Campylobacter mucosalis]|uniref:Eco57I restriction-modification methylase domain-containing protein n=1 Tax=Campylobacter mucosalis TaxID=202 RepID=UPI003D34210E
MAKLSIWLKTAKKGRALTNLSDKIITANSLLNFQFDFKFDVVIGNPPYVRQESIKDIKPKLSEIYSVYNGTADLFVYFYELGIKSLKNGENLREFILNNAQITDRVGYKYLSWNFNRAKRSLYHR